MENEQENKARFMKAIRMINNARTLTLKYMKKYPAFLTRTIDRNSKTIRDSDPLSSTLVAVRQKFPITVKRNHPFLRVLPKDLYMHREDTRYFGRIPAKKEAVLVYQSLQEQPSEEEIKVINAIFDHNLRFWNQLKIIDWSKVTLIYGIPNLERRIVITNPIDEPVDRMYRIDAIAQALGISSLLEYNSVPDYAIQTIKRMLNSEQMGVRSLATTIHMIRNMLDEQPRFLPVIPGISSHFSRVFHAIFQPTYRAVGLPQLNEVSQGRNQVIDEACQMVIHLMYIIRFDANVRSYASKGITVNGTALTYCLRDCHETANIKLAKAILGFKINNEHNILGTKYWQASTKLMPVEVKNKSGYKCYRYHGTETIHFKSENNAGNFIKCETHLISVTLNFTTPMDVWSVYVSIYAYCRFDIEKTTGKTMRRIHQELQALAKRNAVTSFGLGTTIEMILKGIGTAGDLLLNDSTSGKYSYGIINLATGMTYMAPPESYPVFNPIENYYMSESGIQVTSRVREMRIAASSDAIDCFYPILFNKLSVKMRIQRMIKHNIREINKVVQKIEKGIFSNSISVPLPSAMSSNVKKTAVRLCKENAKNVSHASSLSLAVYYTFAQDGIYDKDAKEVSKFKVTGVGEFYFSLLSGSIVLEASGLMVFGIHIIEFPMSGEKECISFNLRGIRFRVDSEINTDLRIINFSHLENYFYNKNEGARVVTYYSATRYVATKDSRLASEKYDTLHRFLKFKGDHDTCSAIRNINFNKERLERKRVSEFSGNEVALKRRALASNLTLASGSSSSS